MVLPGYLKVPYHLTRFFLQCMATYHASGIIIMKNAYAKQSRWLLLFVPYDNRTSGSIYWCLILFPKKLSPAFGILKIVTREWKNFLIFHDKALHKIYSCAKNVTFPIRVHGKSITITKCQQKLYEHCLYWK
jgi:hypothetical protein